MSPGATLLAKAAEQLTLSEPHSVRRACWLARAALEALVDDLLAAHQIRAPLASERAKLSCLEGVSGEDRTLVARVEYAWSRLSEACHQHAYELTPTHQEAEHLLGLVRQVAERAHSGEGGPDSSC